MDAIYLSWLEPCLIWKSNWILLDHRKKNFRSQILSYSLTHTIVSFTRARTHKINLDSLPQTHNNQHNIHTTQAYTRSGTIHQTNKCTHRLETPDEHDNRHSSTECTAASNHRRTGATVQSQTIASPQHANAICCSSTTSVACSTSTDSTITNFLYPEFFMYITILY